MNKYENAISFFNEECAYCNRRISRGITCEICIVRKSLDSLYELLDKYNKLEKALDKACEYLAFDHANITEELKEMYENAEFLYWDDNEWKEWLLKDEVSN